MDGYNDLEVYAQVHAIHARLGLTSPPFSTHQIFSTLYPMIKVVPREMQHHATIEVYAQAVDGVAAVVAYREAAHHSTHRFSCSHELAHWIFDFKEGSHHTTEMPACFSGRGEKPAHERRADHFAAELLVPLHVLDAFTGFAIHFSAEDEDADLDFRSGAQRLASRFNVSLACMKARLYDLYHWRKLAHGRAFSSR